MQAQQGPSPCLFQPESGRENRGLLRHRPSRKSVFEPLESVRLRRQCKRKAVETSIQVCAKRLHVAVERGLELCRCCSRRGCRRHPRLCENTYLQHRNRTPVCRVCVRVCVCVCVCARALAFERACLRACMHATRRERTLAQARTHRHPVQPRASSLRPTPCRLAQRTEQWALKERSETSRAWQPKASRTLRPKLAMHPLVFAPAIPCRACAPAVPIPPERQLPVCPSCLLCCCRPCLHLPQSLPHHLGP